MMQEQTLLDLVRESMKQTFEQSGVAFQCSDVFPVGEKGAIAFVAHTGYKDDHEDNEEVKKQTLIQMEKGYSEAVANSMLQYYNERAQGDPKKVLMYQCDVPNVHDGEVRATVWVV